MAMVIWQPLAESPWPNLCDQRQRQGLDDELADQRAHEPVAATGCCARRVARHHAHQRRVGRVVRRVEHHHERVGDVGVDQLAGRADVRRHEGQKMTPKGTAVQRIHGRNLPHRVCVRSASAPMTGSKTASHSRRTRNIVPTATAESPTVSV